MRWRHFLNRGRADRDRAEEFQSHLQIEIDGNIGRGMAPDQARRAAHLKFGNITLLREQVYSMHFMDVLLRDLRYGLRQLRRSAGFATVAILTLALGIGANVAIYSVMNAVLLRYLPVHDAGRLMFLNTTGSIQAQSGDGDTSLTDNIFEQLRGQHRTFTDLVAFAPLEFFKVPVRYGAGEPAEAQVNLVSGNFFSGLGVRPALGRTFTLEDESSHASLAVLSYGYWTRQLGSDPSVLGQPLYIKGAPFVIVGVAAPDFIGVENKKSSDVWIPLQNRPDMQPWGQPPGKLNLYGTAPQWWCLKTIGRLGPGVTDRQAVAQLNPLFERAALDGISRQLPRDQIPHLYLTPARGIDGMREDYEQPLRVLMVMVGLVLAIACANIAMLLVARTAARRREFSLRMALGADRLRLFRQLLTESLLLVAAASLLGWWFAVWATGALSAWAQLDLSFAPDRAVLLLAVALSLAAVLAFGLAPLHSIVRLPPGNALRTSAATSSQDRRNVRGGQIVVAVQMSLCLALLAGAGLLVDTLRNLESVDLGMRAAGLVVFGVSPQNWHSEADANRFYQAFLDRLRSLPGVESATLMRHRMGAGSSSNSGVLVDGGDPGGKDNSHMRFNVVGPDYFHVLRSPILRGRDFTEADSASAPRVAIVNQTFASSYLPGRDALGHHLTRGNAPPSTIVGVVRDIKYTGVREDGMPMAWFPYTQYGSTPTMQVELRTPGDPAQLLREVRRAVHEFAPGLPLLQPMTQQEQFQRSYSDGRLVARLAVFFGLLAALLVATGLYGTLSYTVSRRTAEVGVRMALGARRGQVLWMVLRGSLLVSLAGLLLGLPLTIAAMRFLGSLLFGVKPGDPWILAFSLAGLILIALGASWIPARRAASVDPMVALRQG